MSRIGGTEVFTRRLSDILSSLGHNIHIVTSDGRSGKVNMSQSNRGQITYSSTEQFLAILKQLSEKGYSLLFTDIPYDIHTKEEFRVDFYHTLESVKSPKILRLRSPQSIKDLFMLHGKEMIDSHFDSFISQAPTTSEMLKKEFGDRCIEIPNGIPLDLFKPASIENILSARGKYGIPANAKVYIYTGRYLPKKGFELIQQAWRKWKKTGDCYLMTVGYHPNEPEYDYSDSHENIIDLGLQSGEGVALALQAADFLLFPSRNEGTSNSLIEAVASGVVPLIYKNTSGMEKMNETNCVYIPERGNGIDDIVAVLDKTLSMEDDVRMSLSQKGRELAKKQYDIEVIGKQYSSLIDRVRLTQLEQGIALLENTESHVIRERR